MNTGLIESWASDPRLMGPIYPFVGSEVFLTIVLVVFWLTLTVWQTRNETAHYRHQLDLLKQGTGLAEIVGKHETVGRSYFGD